MAREPNRMMTVCCSSQGAALKLSFDVGEIVRELGASIEKRLLKNGIAAQWVQEAARAELSVRVVSVDQGNQFLRYLLPFIAPAVLEVEGQVAAGGARPRTFHFVQRAQVGLFGGSSKGMLKVCAQRIAAKVAAEAARP